MTLVCRTLLLRLSAALVVALAACGTTDQRVDGPLTSLVVRGVVEDGVGTPVPDTIVRVWVKWVSCGGEFDSFESDTTSATGEFETLSSNWGTYSQACVQVEAVPPSGAALKVDTLQVTNVPLVPEDVDTLIVQLTLEAN